MKMGVHALPPPLLLLLPTLLLLAADAQVPKQCAYGTPNDGCPKNQHCQSGACVPNANKPAALVATAMLPLEGGTKATSAGRYTNVKLGVDKLPLVVYNRDGGGIVRTQHCNDAACSSMTASNISDLSLTGGNKGRFIDLTMGHDGLPLAVWAGPFIHVAWCQTPSCASSTTKVLHEAKGAYPSITIGADGKPRVAYYLESGALQLATCADPHCMEPVASTTTLAAGAGVGKYPSVGICEGGLPCVAFQDSVKGHLMFAACKDAGCTAAGAPPVTIDDSSDELGTYISMKIGVDSLPVMMYADERSGAIKVAHCAYSTCTAGASSKMPVDHAGIGPCHGTQPFRSPSPPITSLIVLLSCSQNCLEKRRRRRRRRRVLRFSLSRAIDAGCYGEFPELDISPLNGFPILSYFNQVRKKRISFAMPFYTQQ